MRRKQTQPFALGKRGQAMERPTSCSVVEWFGKTEREREGLGGFE
jgi:hypothetical protein